MKDLLKNEIVKLERLVDVKTGVELAVALELLEFNKNLLNKII